MLVRINVAGASRAMPPLAAAVSLLLLLLCGARVGAASIGRAASEPPRLSASAAVDASLLLGRPGARQSADGKRSRPESVAPRWAQAESTPPDGSPERDPLFDDDYDRQLDAKPAGFPDPLEPVNRGALRFNRLLDRFVLDPVTKLYDLVVPEPVEPAIRRSFRHFASTSILLNDVLQVHPRSAGRTAVRLLVNSTVGIGGLFDFARCSGYYRHGADFGQTLWHYGVGSGPYLVLPVFGPSNVRDASGDLVDGLFHPVLYVLGPAQQLTYGSGYGLAAREEHYKALEALEDSAIDFYAALRNAYYQVRQSELNAGTNPGPPKEDEYDGRCTRTLSSDASVDANAPRGGGYVSPVSRWSRF